MHANFAKFLAALVLVLGISFTAPAAEAGTRRAQESFTPQQLRTLVRDAGFDDVRIDGDGDLIVEMQGYVVLILAGSYDNKNLQIRFAIVSNDVDMDDINRWNREKRFTSAYLDGDGDPVLEMDVDYEGGITRERIKDALTTFDRSLRVFLREVV